MEAIEAHTKKSYADVDSTGRILSVAGGAALLTTGLKSLNKPSFGSFLRVLGGAYLLYRGAKGHCPITEAITGSKRGFVISERMLIYVPKEQVYAAWRKLSNLPKFMKHLVKVDELNPVLSHWVMQIPGVTNAIEWNARIMLDYPGEKIVWQSVDDSEVQNYGEVLFKDVQDGKYTEVQATMTYLPPVGAVGASIAHLFSSSFESIVRDDLRRFKLLLENGTVRMPREQLVEVVK